MSGLIYCREKDGWLRRGASCDASAALALTAANPVKLAVFLVAILAMTVGPVSVARAQSGNDAGDSWRGTLKGHAQGNVYNDTAEVDFSFSEKPDGSIAGSLHAKVTNAPQRMGDCVQTHTFEPAEFDGSFSGQRQGKEFQLDFSKFRATARYSAKCSGHGGTSPPLTIGAFGGLSAASDFVRPTIKAEDGAKKAFHVTIGSIEADGSIELHRKPCHPTLQMLQAAFDRAFKSRGIATPGQYIYADSSAPDSMGYGIPIRSAQTGDNYDLVPTTEWIVSQMDSGKLPYPQPAGHSMLMGSVEHVDGRFRVYMRIDDLATGEVLMTSKGDGGDCPDGLNTAVANALANLPVPIKSYAPARAPVAPR